MKKYFLFLFVVFLLAIPFTASADGLGEGSLNVDWNYPSYNNYYLDYNGTVTTTTVSGIITGSSEDIFCVSPDEANGSEEVTFYSIGSTALDELIGDTYSDNISKAAWIADHYKALGYNDSEAQIAIWCITGVVPTIQDYYYDFDGNRYGTDNIDKKDGLLDLANDWKDYTTDNWALAISGDYASGEGDNDYQDYLVPMNPVPEPATMLLLGTGLIGLAGFGRKRFLK